jgi:hypothetical protein
MPARPRSSPGWRRQGLFSRGGAGGGGPAGRGRARAAWSSARPPLRHRLGPSGCLWRWRFLLRLPLTSSSLAARRRPSLPWWPNPVPQRLDPAHPSQEVWRATVAVAVAAGARVGAGRQGGLSAWLAYSRRPGQLRTEAGASAGGAEFVAGCGALRARGGARHGGTCASWLLAEADGGCECRSQVRLYRLPGQRGWRSTQLCGCCEELAR